MASCGQRTAHEAVYVNSSYFEPQKKGGVLENPKLNEISGIIASRTMPGYYWVHNDSGGEAELYLINEQAKHVATVQLEGIKNRDWEELGYYQDYATDRGYLYIGDIGDNAAKHKQITLYRIEEPTLNVPKISTEALENARRPKANTESKGDTFPKTEELMKELDKELARLKLISERRGGIAQKS
ncbi:MAG: hypothetical protein HC912_06915 [Saprospiraceae bacterium]|nr:hypothetical protein [Saprospiraceae bacterium]